LRDKVEKLRKEAEEELKGVKKVKPSELLHKAAAIPLRGKAS